MQFVLRKDFHIGGHAYAIIDRASGCLVFDADRLHATQFDGHQEAVKYRAAASQADGMVTIIAVEDTPAKGRRPFKRD